MFLRTSTKRSVIGLVFNQDRSKVLTIKRRDVAIWVFPGGGIDLGETPEQAIIREVHEETGLHVSINRHVATYLPVNRLTHITYVFECHQISGNLSVGPETKEIGFFCCNSLPTPFFFLHLEWLKDACQQLNYPLQKYLTQINYWTLFHYFCKNPLQVLRLLLSRLGKPYNNI